MTGILAASLLFSPVAIAQNVTKDGKYDNHAAFVDESKFSINKIIDSVETVQSRVLLKVTYEALNGNSGLSWVNFGGLGSGVVIKKEGGFAYILTNHHVIDGIVSLGALNLKVNIEKSIKIERESSEIYIQKSNSRYSLEEVISNEDLDIALLKVKDSDDFKAFPYRTGNSDDMESADFVYIIGSPLGIKDYVLDGNVSKLYIEKKLNNPWQHQIIKDDKSFMIDCEIQPGCSGAPVIAIRDGEYELVGIVNSVYMKKYWDARSGGFVYDPMAGYGVAIKINPIMEWVDKYFKSLKKDKPEKNQRPSGRGPAF